MFWCLVKTWLLIMLLSKLGAPMRHLCVMTVLLALVGCATPPTPAPTLSPQELATRLAQIPTAAINPTSAAPRAAPPSTSTPAVSPTTVAAEQQPTLESPAQKSNTGDYVVREGDTLSSVAFAFNVSMASIQIANNLGSGQIIQVGQKLTIPSQKRFPDENVFWFVTVVDPGDTLTAISAKYGVSVEDLMRVNQLSDASAIRIGQDLIVPVSAPAPAPSTGGPVSDEPVPAVQDSVVAEALATAAPSVIELQPLVAEAIAIEAPVAAPIVPTEPAMRSVSIASASDGQSGDIEGMRQTLLALYNQARSEEGQAPLAASFILQNAAHWHAEDCAQRGFGSHVGSDGSGTRVRIQRAGYSGNISGENWAWARSAEQAFNMWFHQETPTGPHRANIMSSRYAEVGFGVVPAHGGYYFIADFGAP